MHRHHQINVPADRDVWPRAARRLLSRNRKAGTRRERKEERRGFRALERCYGQPSAFIKRAVQRETDQKAGHIANEVWQARKKRIDEFLHAR